MSLMLRCGCYNIFVRIKRILPYITYVVQAEIMTKNSIFTKSIEQIPV
jgi:hypothetical protein